MPMTATPQVGTMVQYLGHEDTPMAAVVILTADTYKPERDPSEAAKPSDETSVSLLIFRPVSGRPYVRHNVPLNGSEAHQLLVEAAADYAEAQAAKDAQLPEGVTQADLDESAEEAG